MPTCNHPNGLNEVFTSFYLGSSDRSDNAKFSPEIADLYFDFIVKMSSSTYPGPSNTYFTITEQSPFVI